jgi:hypothetical protein
VDQSAEQIASAKIGSRGQWRRVARVRREQLESAMWPVLVVMAAVDAEHVFEMAAAFDEGVRVRRLNRRLDHLDALGSEDFVEGAAELRVAIMNEEPEGLIGELQDEVARLLADPASVRVAVGCTNSVACRIPSICRKIDYVHPTGRAGCRVR